MNQTVPSRLRDGERARVTGFAGVGDMGRRHRDMGLVRGIQVECHVHSLFGEPAASRIRGAVVALRREDSRRVQAVLL